MSERAAIGSVRAGTAQHPIQNSALEPKTLLGNCVFLCLANHTLRICWASARGVNIVRPKLHRCHVDDRITPEWSASVGLFQVATRVLRAGCLWERTS